MVVFVHGSLDRSSGFARCAGHLRDLHTIRYDRRGYGKSVGMGSPTIDGHVDDLIEVLDGRHCVVVGHSLGGIIALGAAQLKPDLIRAVGAYEAPMPWVEWWPKRSAGGEAMTAGDDLSPEAAGDAAERFMRRMIGDERWEQLPAGAKDARRAEGPALLAELRSARTGAPYDLDAITTRVLVGHSTESKEHHRWAAQELARLLHTTPLVIDGAGHGAHASHHREFAGFVRAAVAAGQ
ncbi:MAG TPA: alpha/beta hydrolase [Acidimicrobiales bacterium]|jgi:pimeloyl-ACP methyl ester carboxylesterase|nr:alpha/beta hydrolase [Acidimicrobiales bacterium]